MSTYFVQGSTMDAIADAINAKTGGSSAMTPAQMVTAIGTISGGGIDPTVFTQVGTFTLQEDVREFDCDISNLDYTKYIVTVNGSGTGADFLYFSCAPTGNSYSVYITGNTYNNSVALSILKAGTTYGSNTLENNLCHGAVMSGNGNETREQPSTISKIRIFAYRSNGVINAGTTITIYGGY